MGSEDEPGAGPASTVAAVDAASRSTTAVKASSLGFVFATAGRRPVRSVTETVEGVSGSSRRDCAVSVGGVSSDVFVVSVLGECSSRDDSRSDASPTVDGDFDPLAIDHPAPPRANAAATATAAASASTCRGDELFDCSADASRLSSRFAVFGVSLLAAAPDGDPDGDARETPLASFASSVGSNPRGDENPDPSTFSASSRARRSSASLDAANLARKSSNSRVVADDDVSAGLVDSARRDLNRRSKSRPGASIPSFLGGEPTGGDATIGERLGGDWCKSVGRPSVLASYAAARSPVRTEVRRPGDPEAEVDDVDARESTADPTASAGVPVEVSEPAPEPAATWSSMSAGGQSVADAAARAEDGDASEPSTRTPSSSSSPPSPSSSPSPLAITPMWSNSFSASRACACSDGSASIASVAAAPTLDAGLGTPSAAREGANSSAGSGRWDECGGSIDHSVGSAGLVGSLSVSNRSRRPRTEEGVARAGAKKLPRRSSPRPGFDFGECTDSDGSNAGS